MILPMNTIDEMGSFHILQFLVQAGEIRNFEARSILDGDVY